MHKTRPDPQKSNPNAPKRATKRDDMELLKHGKIICVKTLGLQHSSDESEHTLPHHDGGGARARTSRFQHYSVSDYKSHSADIHQSAVPGQAVRVNEGALVDTAAVVGADVVDAHPRVGDGVARPLGALRVEELQLLSPGELVVCGTGGREGGRDMWPNTR